MVYLVQNGLQALLGNLASVTLKMAHSIQNFGDKFETFNDGDLSVSILILNHEVLRNPNQYRTIRDIIRQWKQNLPFCGPGTIDLKFDDVILSPETKHEFARLLSSAYQALNAFANEIPESYLKEINNVPDVQYHSYPTSRGKIVINEFRDLLV